MRKGLLGGINHEFNESTRMNAIHLIIRARVKLLLRGYSRASNAKTSAERG